MNRVDTEVKTLDRQLLDEIARTYPEEGGTPDYWGTLINRAHVMRYFSLSFHRNRELVKNVVQLGRDKKILDAGISYGFADITLKEIYGFDITGLELQENIGIYCQLPIAHGIEVIAGQLGKEPCPVPDGSFDIVILSEVLEHLRISPMTALREIHRILKPGGYLILTTPNIARL